MAYEFEIAAILAHPLSYEWRAHGIGFLKTYLDEDKTVRLNLWHHRLQVPGITIHHTHPWGLHSQIVAGRITNYRYTRSREGIGDRYYEGRINCADFKGIEGDPELVWLKQEPPEFYTVGQSYRQDPHEIHETGFQDGTVTVMQRVPAPETGGVASVFWEVGAGYVDATRPWRDDDLWETISAVRRQMKL